MRKTTFIALALAATFLGAASAQAAQVVGNTVAVNPDAKGTPPAAQPRTLVLGTGLVFNERIDTSGEGLVQVLLLDGTSMIVGSNSSIAINKFVYDPEKRDGSLAVTLGEGTMRFIGGALSKKQGAQITTPVGTLAVRGAIADLTERRFSLVFGKELIFIGKDGKTERVLQGHTLVVGSDGRTETHKTTPQEVSAMQKGIQSTSGSNGGATVGAGSIDSKIESDFAEVNSGQDAEGVNEPNDGTDTGQTQPAEGIADDVIDTAGSDRVHEEV